MLLPYELAGLISFYLSPRDIYECIFVCRAWYAAFLPSIYQYSILCRDSMIVYQRLLHSSTEMGRCVQKLIVDDGILTLDDMQQLYNKCPNLSMLHFRWCTSVSDKKASKPSPSTTCHFFRSPNPLLDAIDGGRLSHLSLECYESPSSWKYNAIPLSTRRHHYGNIQILKHTPNLKSLSLSDFFSKFQIKHLDRIHAYCPDLIELELVGTMSESSIECDEPELVQQRSQRFLRQQHPYQHHRVEKQYKMNFNDTLALMRKFRLVYPKGWHSLSTWLEYFLVRYTHLNTLVLQNTGPLPAQFHPTVLFFLYAGFQLPSTLRQVSFIHLGATNIKRLHPSLAYLRCLTDVCIRDQGIHYFFNFSGLIASIRFVIQRLWIPLPAHATVRHYEQLNYCYHLKDLTLEMSQQQQTIRLDLLFKYCCGLKSLTLIHTRLTPEMIQSIPVSLYFDSHNRTSKNSSGIQLEKFGLENTSIEQGERTLNQLLVYVLRSVVDLSLVNCTFQQAIDKRGWTLFHLPERKFRSVHILNACVCFANFVRRIPGIPNYPVTLFRCHQQQPVVSVSLLKNDVMTNSNNKKRQRSSNTPIMAQWYEAPIHTNEYQIHRLDPDYDYQHPSILQVNQLNTYKMEQVTHDPYDTRSFYGPYKRYARMITLSGYMTFLCANIETLHLNRHIIR
ncbi:hypothetical protein BDA99DRAFT_535236 [Phascolomyces articulosus]|uniref:F-box domain-containing protein n=1 Tax=Phascolomyces articulosus TaxID=60185 RepID=A0AAD5PGG6_9FUNG|nr:hypothetical protein BDA99DRAFT_535236 [Phascolomyces articulosus]